MTLHQLRMRISDLIDEYGDDDCEIVAETAKGHYLDVSDILRTREGVYVLSLSKLNEEES